MIAEITLMDVSQWNTCLRATLSIAKWEDCHVKLQQQITWKCNRMQEMKPYRSCRRRLPIRVVLNSKMSSIIK